MHRRIVWQIAANVSEDLVDFQGQRVGYPWNEGYRYTEGGPWSETWGSSGSSEKRMISTRLHSVTSHKAVIIYIVTAIITTNIRNSNLLHTHNNCWKQTVKIICTLPKWVEANQTIHSKLAFKSKYIFGYLWSCGVSIFKHGWRHKLCSRSFDIFLQQ